MVDSMGSVVYIYIFLKQTWLEILCTLHLVGQTLFSFLFSLEDLRVFICISV